LLDVKDLKTGDDLVGKYGEAAVKAVNLMIDNNIENPINAWETITKDIFGEGTPSQRKSCPKNTFLGLCESGLVKGIPGGLYTRSQKNKEYGLRAVNMIAKNPRLINDMNSLWIQTIGNEPKIHNSQMDVVISLWKNEMIMK
jgi:hypothetical protein